MSASNDNPRGGVIFYPTGPEAPDAPYIRDRLAVIMRNAFGVDLDVSTYTPQGQILDTWTAIVFDKNNNMVFLVEMWNPETSEGRYQDNICKIYFISRKPAIPTKVTCECVGLIGTIIPAGSIVQDGMDRQYINVEPIVIPATGTAEGAFYCTTPGPVVVNADFVDTIVTNVNGWDTVNNSAPGITGSYEETRAALEHRRYLSVAKNAHGNVSAIQGAVWNLDNVISVNIAENVDDLPALMGGVIVPGHSIFLSVVGGDDQEIAHTMYERKDAGCGMAGNNPVEIYVPTEIEDETQQITYVFNRPLPILCRVRVTIKVLARLTPGDIDDLIRAEVFATWNGQRSIPRARSGETVYASGFYCPLNNMLARYDLVDVQVSRVTPIVTTIPPDAFYYQYEDKTYTKTTAMLVNEYPQFFSLADVNKAFIIDDSGAEPSTEWLPWGEEFDTRIDENPTLLMENILVEHTE